MPAIPTTTLSPSATITKMITEPASSDGKSVSGVVMIGGLMMGSR
jgi:hypothetical protein